MSKERVADIGKKDVIWNYIATFLQIGAGAILLPFILNMLDSETVGIWSIFTSITTFLVLLDFGFAPSFTRNISYIFSGVVSLKAKGLSQLSDNLDINYSLLSGTIKAMRWFYQKISLILLLIMLVGGSFYIYFLLESYSGPKTEVWVAWIILNIINSYSLYTSYYDSLLSGKGLVMRSKQIRIVGQVVYLSAAIILIYIGYGLVAIVAAQGLSTIIKRVISKRVFFTTSLREKLKTAPTQEFREILNAIYPNALKLGVSSIGGLLLYQAPIFIGSIYLSLADIGSYGITNQLVTIIASLAGVYYMSFTPKISEYRVSNNTKELRKNYITSFVFLISIFIIVGGLFILLGDWALTLIGSKTELLGASLITYMLIFSFLEKNNGLASTFLLAKNEVPFYKASLCSGVLTTIVTFISLAFLGGGLLEMILIPLIIQSLYQYWKWPSMVIKELFVYGKS